jgi:transcriptional regulator with XRE-family HTH domain
MDATELGRQVLAKRKEKGLSQSELGNLVGISRNYVSQIERGVARSISMKVVNQLAVALGVSAGELTGERSQITIPPSLREFGIENNLSYEVIDKLARIPKRGKEPKSIKEWQELYTAIMPFIEGAEQEFRNPNNDL